MKKILLHLLAITACAGATFAAPLTPRQSLGKKLFFDPGLSNPPGQSCASCHDPSTGWTGPDSGVNAGGAVEQGAIPNRFGNRKPPMSAYAGLTPTLRYHDPGMGGGGMGGGGMGMTPGFVGGLFWDGRATGWILGDPLADQAIAPFLNPLEMANPNPHLLCNKVRGSEYAGLFMEVWGVDSLNCARKSGEVLEQIAHSIAAYEKSPEVNPFNSRFDDFYDNVRSARPPLQMINMNNIGRFRDKGLNEMELQGLVVFNGKGKCSKCHLLQPMGEGGYPLFTDFRYHNLGIPKNSENPFYGMPAKWNPAGEDWIDPGLGGFLAATDDYAHLAGANMGKHRTPSLRNVDRRPEGGFVKAYGHNGYFKTLMHVIHFYNVRDADPDCVKSAGMGMPCIEPPEVGDNLNMDLGNLGLTPSEGMALLQFLMTLSDTDRTD